MRILICSVSSSRRPSGICRHSANLARCLAERDDVSSVVLLVGPWQLQYFTSAFGLRHPKLQLIAPNVYPGALARNAWYMRVLPSVARDYAADIVHLAYPAPLIRNAFGRPVVTSIHDLYPYDIPGNFGRSRVYFNRLFLRQSLNNSAAIVCSSDFTLNRLRSLKLEAAKTKSIRIYQSVEFCSVSSRPPMMPEIDGRRFLLSVAQHRRNKNLELLLQGYAELRRRDSQWEECRLVIVGSSGPETPRLQRVVRQLSLHRHVLFSAPVTDEELCWLYRHCSSFVATSSIEGFGLPIVEALQCGARVVCSAIPVFHEIAGNAAHFFDLQTSSPAESLADAIVACLQETPLQPAALDKFSPELIAEQHLSLYSDLLASHITYASGSEAYPSTTLAAIDK